MFVLFTNRKSHVDFWLVQKSVTLNDLERRSVAFFAETVGFGAYHNILAEAICDESVAQRLLFLTIASGDIRLSYHIGNL